MMAEIKVEIESPAGTVEILLKNVTLLGAVKLALAGLGANEAMQS
jgi:hypothetical protein